VFWSRLSIPRRVKPVEGATISVAFHRRTQTVTASDGTAMLKLSSAEAQDSVFDVGIVNKQYDQHFGYSESGNEWMNRPEDFIPTKPDIVFEVTSRIDEQRAEAELEKKHRSDEQAAERLFQDSPDFWPERKDDPYPFPVDDVGQLLLTKQWERASKGELGSQQNGDSIRAAVVHHMKHPQAKVGEIRWVSRTVVMVSCGWYRSPLASAGYTYVLRNTEQGWTVVAYYMNYVS
jgi:hypothetical protein